MKRFSARLCALMAGVAMLASCLNDSDDSPSATYDDTAIASFTLGTLNRYTHSTSSSTGNDTIVKTTLTGSLYKMTIDHVARRVWNETPLPVGTDAEHVICTVTAKNGGVVALKSATSDSLRWHSATDSVDLTLPRIFRVYSSSGAYYRDYEVELHVSTTVGTTFGWALAGTIGAVDDFDGKLLVAAGDSVALADRDSVVGRATHEQYMMGQDGQLWCQRLDGGLWQQEPLDDADSLLPAAGHTACVSWAYAPADQTDYVLLVGMPRQADVDHMRVWRKIAPHQGGGRWVYMPVDDLNHYPMPRQERLSMACYDGTVLAVGSDLVVRQSRDQGISWRESSTYALPATLTGTAVTMTASDNGHLWLLTDTGQLWEGKKR